MNEEKTHEEIVLGETHVDVKKKKSGDSFFEIFKFAILAIIIVIPIRLFIAQPFVVSGSSMVPTFEDGQYLIVDELSYHLHEPARGDVVIFRYPKNTSVFFIKRMIAFPGETVDIKDGVVKIINAEHPEGFVLDQPFLKNISHDDFHTTVPADQYFVMGDNRPYSSDSRSWGTVPKKDMTGRALLRLFPLSTLSVLPGDYHFKE